MTQGEACRTAESVSLAEEVAELRSRLERVEDREAIVRLQYQYGYYIDNRMWAEMAGLFADGACEMEIGQRGVYVGRDRIARFLRETLGGGRWGLLKDEIIHHIQLQPVVTLSEDGQFGQCRARALMLGNSPPGTGQFLLAEGLYENTYTKQADGWRIQRLWWMPTFYFQLPGFDAALFESGPPSAEFAPDRLSVPKDEALGRRFPGFHYVHPVTGDEVPGPASEGG